MKKLILLVVLALLTSGCLVRMSDGQVFDCHMERIGFATFAWVCPRVQ